MRRRFLIWLPFLLVISCASHQSRFTLKEAGLGGPLQPSLRQDAKTERVRLKLTRACGATETVPTIGFPTVVVFVAPYCPPCKRVVADLDRLARRQGFSGVRFLAVTLPDHQQIIRHDVRSTVIEVAVDQTGNGYRAFAITGVPAVVFIDVHGKKEVVYREAVGFDALHKASIKIKRAPTTALDTLETISPLLRWPRSMGKASNVL